MAQVVSLEFHFFYNFRIKMNSEKLMFLKIEFTD